MFSHVVAARPVSDEPVCALAVDAEEDFNWDLPVACTRFSILSMRRIRQLHDVIGVRGVRPTYLLTYPVLDDDDAVALLRAEIAAGACEVGVQLHPWVNPPFDGPDGLSASFSGNLAPELEERKLLALKARFEDRFGHAPAAYRAGRYGFGPNTAALLERHGFTMDTSLAPRTISHDEGGPDYADFDYRLFWFGQSRRLLEVPLCRSIVGWGGRLAPQVYRALSSPSLARFKAPALLTRLRFAERITLSPEGNDVAAMLRLVRHLRARGQTMFVLSFHSSSLVAGQNPYVRDAGDLAEFHARLVGVLDGLSGEFGFRFATLSEFAGLLRERENTPPLVSASPAQG